MPKGVYPHTHIKPREYPEDIVELVRELYTARGMTVLEVQAALPKGFKAQRIIERYIPVRRKAAKRDQRGPRNTAWKGNAASNTAVHVRLCSERGPARNYTCTDCPATAGEWSYQGGAPDERQSPRGPYTSDLTFYVPRCISCHRRFDHERRTP